MIVQTTRFVILVAAACVTAACSKPAADAHAPGAASSGRAAVNPGSACERRLLTASDLEGILHAPIAGTRPLKGDPQTCYFVTATSESQGGPEIMVSVRPGLGRVTLKSWASGGMGTTGTAMSGVGDEAIWVSELKELDAQKNDTLCVISLGGSALIEHFDELQKRFGDLCNKVFARGAS